ncbi:hypothetical protein HRI_000006500 [Hibiscus trionum]|uniref:Uncharacterized protein n=1 Tax=Hibiscus trionum TaxID=183268 RepID=A0A9W7GQT6_HIBTR|nr:hypothetical protein HRI_000006500 [Hibiscus trionum]
MASSFLFLNTSLIFISLFSVPIVNAPEPNDQNNIGSLNEGDAASFSEQPVEETPNVDANMDDAPPTKDATSSGSKLKSTQSHSNPALNWAAQEDSIPSPTAEQIKKFDAEIPSAPAPSASRGTKRHSPIQVLFQPKKAKPSGSTSKAGMSSSKNSPAAADSQPRRAK